MGVASCRSIFLLSDVVFNRASVSPCFRFDSQLDSDQSSCVLWASVPSRDPAQPDLDTGRAPLAPHAPSLSISFCFPRSNLLSFSLPPLSHLFALGYHRILDPKVSPPLPLSSPFLFFLLSAPRALSPGHVPYRPSPPSRAPSGHAPPRCTRPLAAPLPGALAPGRALPSVLGPLLRPL
jgi:hypothetical protein